MPQPFKHPTTHVYYYRRKVPQALQSALGREYKRSLGTKDLDTAKGLFRAEDVRCEQAFALARAQAGSDSSAITPEDAKQLASRWYYNESMRLDKVGVFTDWLTEDYTAVDPSDGAETVLYTTLREGWERDGEGWPSESMARPHIVAALRGFNVPVPDKSSVAWAWLVTQFDERIHQLSTWALTRHDGGRALPGEGALPRAPLSIEASTLAAPASSKARRGRSISQLFMAYEKAKLAGDPSRSTRASLKDYAASIRTFIELFEDLDVGEIDRDVASDFHLLLAKLPANGRGMSKLSAKQKIERAEREELPKIEAGTVRNRVRHLSAVLSFGVRRGWLLENPINLGGVGREAAQAATRQQRANRQRKHYEPEELAAIFSSVAFTDLTWKPARASYGRAWYWLPVLMYYTGARIEELAQMSASEVMLSPTEVWYLSILESIDGLDGERTVKTSSSRRAIPLHADVLARGFLEYVRGLPTSARLFPELDPCPKGRYATNFAKRWGFYLRETVGLKSTARPSHGFRHTFKTLAREAQIPIDVNDAITGHAGKGVGQQYGEMPLKTMAAALRQFPTITEIVERVQAAKTRP
jgi:integrase